MVAVRVAVQDEVVRAVADPETDRHAVVDAQPLVDIVASLIIEADRLRVTGDRHLHAHDLEALEVEPRPGDAECVHASAGGLHVCEIKDGFLAGKRAVTNRAARLAAAVEQRDVREDALLARDPVTAHPVVAPAEKHGVSGPRVALGALDRRKGSLTRSRRRIVAVGCDEEFGGGQADQKQQRRHEAGVWKKPHDMQLHTMTDRVEAAGVGQTASRAQAGAAAARRRSWPQAASMSGPRDRRKCATMPRSRRMAANAAASSSRAGSYATPRRLIPVGL